MDLRRGLRLFPKKNIVWRYKVTAEMKLRRGLRLFRNKSIVWRCMKVMAVRGIQATTGVYQRLGDEMGKARCMELTAARGMKAAKALYQRLGNEMDNARCMNAKATRGMEVKKAIYQRLRKGKETETARRSTEAMTADWGFGNDRSSSMVEYNRPAIPKSPANYGCEVTPPFFQCMSRQIDEGFRIAEILEVGITTKGVKEIRGNIEAQCYWVEVKLFDRYAGNPQIVHGKDLLELTRPRFGMPGRGPLEIKAEIDVGSDESVGMIVSWRKSEKEFNKFYEEESIRGKNGSSLHVSYVVYDRAIDAFIKITFDPYCPVKICGFIESYDNVLHSNKSVLFCKKGRVGYLSVGQEQQLPLMRSRVPVPVDEIPSNSQNRSKSYDGAFMMDFNLINFDDKGIIAVGHLEFRTKHYGVCVRKISSNYGVIRVEVGFNIPAEEFPTED